VTGKKGGKEKTQDGSFEKRGGEMGSWVSKMGGLATQVRRLWKPKCANSSGTGLISFYHSIMNFKFKKVYNFDYRHLLHETE